MIKSVGELSMEHILEEEEAIALELEAYNMRLQTLDKDSDECKVLAQEIADSYKDFVEIKVEKELAEGLLSGTILLN